MIATEQKTLDQSSLMGSGLHSSCAFSSLISYPRLWPRAFNGSLMFAHFLASDIFKTTRPDECFHASIQKPFTGQPRKRTEEEVPSDVFSLIHEAPLSNEIPPSIKGSLYVTLNMYAIEFEEIDCSADPLQVDAANFVLLLEETLNLQALPHSITLSLPRNTNVKAVTSFIKKEALHLQQVNLARRYHARMLTTVLRKEQQQPLADKEEGVFCEEYVHGGMEDDTVPHSNWSFTPAYLLLPAIYKERLEHSAKKIPNTIQDSQAGQICASNSPESGAVEEVVKREKWAQRSSESELSRTAPECDQNITGGTLHESDRGLTSEDTRSRHLTIDWLAIYEGLNMYQPGSRLSKPKSTVLSALASEEVTGLQELERRVPSSGIDSHFTEASSEVKGQRTATFTDQLDPAEAGMGSNLESFTCGNGVFSRDEVLGSLVESKHTSVSYYVVEISSLTSESPFPEKESKYKSFQDYFAQKYGMRLYHPEQQLVCLRRPPKATNMLDVKPEPLKASSSQRYGEYLPPELCLLRRSFRGRILRGAVRLPAVMHRLQALLLAAELKDRIGLHHMPADKLLVALTATGCCEGFSYQRYEMLGDSYLKYAVARFLFLKFTDAQEGTLTAELMAHVRNSHLFNLAVAAGLPGYMATQPFDPSTWEAPGLPPVQRGEQQTICPSGRGLAEGSNGSTKVFVDGESALPAGRHQASGQLMSSKTIADVVEALIGLYVSDGGGEKEALHVMGWLGMEEGLGSKLGPPERPGNEAPGDGKQARRSISDSDESFGLEPPQFPSSDNGHLPSAIRPVQGARGETAGDSVRKDPDVIVSKSADTGNANARSPLSQVPANSYSDKRRAREPLPALPPPWLLERATELLDSCEAVKGELAIEGAELASVEAKLGYKFNRRWLLEEALLHPSCQLSSSSCSFERLEYLGDAVLDYLVTKHLVEAFPQLDPGRITDLKQAAANNERFARATLGCQLHHHFRVVNSPLSHNIAAFAAAVEEEALAAEQDKGVDGSGQGERGGPGDNVARHSFGHVTRSAPKSLGDVFEAVAAAVLLDSGLDVGKLWQVIKPLLSPLPEPKSTAIHPIRQLQELCQKNHWPLEVRSPPHPSGIQRVEVWINHRILAVEHNINTQTARRLAAMAALKNLTQTGLPKVEVTMSDEVLAEMAEETAERATYGHGYGDTPPLESSLEGGLHGHAHGHVGLEDVAQQLPGSTGIVDQNLHALAGRELSSRAEVPSVSGHPLCGLPPKELAYLQDKEGRRRWWKGQDRICVDAALAGVPTSGTAGELTSSQPTERSAGLHCDPDEIGVERTATCQRDEGTSSLLRSGGEASTSMMEADEESGETATRSFGVSAAGKSEHPGIIPEPNAEIRKLMAAILERYPDVTGQVATPESLPRPSSGDNASSPPSALEVVHPGGSAITLMEDLSSLQFRKGWTRQALNELCSRRHWLLPSYVLCKAEGPSHSKSFIFSASMVLDERKVEEVGKAMPSHAKAKDSAAACLLNRLQQLKLV